MRDKINLLRRRVDLKQFELNKIKEDNKKAVEIQDKIDSLESIKTAMIKYNNLLTNILLRAKEEDNAYKKRRLKFVENSIAEGISHIFPDQVRIPKIEYKTERNKMKARLVLYDEMNQARKPRNTEGGLMQQLISFSSSMSIVSLLNTNKFYIDEAFSASSPENRMKIASILDMYTKRGIQIILISQESSLYESIDRREIYLKLEDNQVKVDKILDMEG